MRICDVCNGKQGDDVVTYMAAISTMYSPHVHGPLKEYRCQVELCRSCVEELSRAVSGVIEDRAGVSLVASKSRIA